MLGTTPMIHALGGGGPLRLVAPGALAAGVAFARASTGHSLGPDGLAWQEAAAQQPRFHGTARRLLVAGERGNAIRNPRYEGGSATALPTYFGNFSGTGVTRSYAYGTAAGLPFLDVALSGTAGSAALRIYAEDAGAVAVTPGEVVTFSTFVALTGGSLSNVTGLGLSLLWMNASGTTVSTTAGPDLRAGLTGQAQRAALTATPPAEAASVRPFVNFGWTNGAAVSLTLRLQATQLERGGFATTPILPPPGSPGTAARATDQPTMALSAARAAQGTLVGTFVLPQPAQAGIEQGLLQLDDGTDGNRIALRNAAGSTTVEAAIVSSAGTALLPGGSIAAGTPFRAALAWGGGVALCLGGGAVQAAGALPPGLSRLLVGHAAAGFGRPAFGEIGPLDLHPTRLPDATLQALTAS